VFVKFVIAINERNDEYKRSSHTFYCNNKNLIEKLQAVSGTKLADGQTDLPVKHLFFVHCAKKAQKLTSN
jgi:hypothetical protein